MQAVLITIGDEILIGQVVDTNSAHIARELNHIGISVYQITSVQDQHHQILAALAHAAAKAPVVLITGGLGPTKDDRTKQAICEYFNDILIQNDDVLAHIENLFANQFATPLLEVNRKQAWVPSKATVLPNHYGTAPGIWMEKDKTIFIFLPGVPYEMKALLQAQVLPRLQKKFQTHYILHKTLVVYGVGESTLAHAIENWEDGLPGFIKLAYLPSPGKVRLRLSAQGPDRKTLDEAVEKQLQALYPLLKGIIYGLEEDNPIEKSIGKQLIKIGKTLAIAESCTGGSIARQITTVPGASAYFTGGVVCYATASKTTILNIPVQLIEKYSVVSAPVAEAMAQNVQRLFNTHFAIATTGNAGPDKGDSDAEAGTVFIAIATPNSVFSEEFHFGIGREKVIGKSVNKALELLYREILKF